MDSWAWRLVLGSLASVLLLGCTQEAAQPRDELFEDKGGLQAIRERGTLRVIVPKPGGEFLPRTASFRARDRNLVTALAARLGVAVRFIEISRYDRLLPSLRAGKADLVAAQLTMTEPRRERVAFSRPTATVDEILVARKGAGGVPQSPKDLAGREVHVRAQSSYAQTLRKLARSSAPGLKVVPVAEDVDSETIAYQVSRGERPLTVLDSNIWQAVQRYNDKLRALFPIARGRKQAWAMRRENAALKQAVDRFLLEKSLMRSRGRFRGDLAGIRKRGVLRVLTRNNPVTYYLHGGKREGFDYTLMKRYADHLGVRLEMVVPPRRDQLIPWLLQGRGDIIAASLSVTEARKKRIAFSLPYLFVHEQVVQASDAARTIDKLSQLQGRELHVRKSSSYYQRLQALRPEIGAVNIVPVAEHVETETLVARVGEGEIPLTVADSHLLAVERHYRDNIRVALTLPQPQKRSVGHERMPPLMRAEAQQEDVVPIAFGLRPEAKKLRRAIDGWLTDIYRGLEYNMAKRYYFQNKKNITRAKKARVGVSGQLSPYDGIIKKYAQQYDLDWRLLVAQAYQESRFDADAKSFAGARGLFQLLPSTARELGFENLKNPRVSAHAAAKYMRQLISRFSSTLPLAERVRFALASYNAGIGHVQDARRLAEQRGWDAQQWFDNVERAMLLLQQPAYYKHARYGYCRGAEPVKYVDDIQSRYDNYIKTLSQGASAATDDGTSAAETDAAQ